MNLRHRGFTLVEMLVALSVSALLVSLVYGSVRVGQRSARALGVQTTQAEVMRIGWQFLHNALARARAVPDPSDNQDRTGFQGMSNVLSFVADMPAYIGLGGLMRITLEIEETDTGRQLVLSRRSIDITSDLPPEDNVERAVLVESLDTLAITYFGQIKGDAAPAWYGNWDNTHRKLPNLLQISVEPTGGPAWPVLIASPLMGAEPLEMPVPTSERSGAETAAATIQ